MGLEQSLVEVNESKGRSSAGLLPEEVSMLIKILDSWGFSEALNLNMTNYMERTL